MRDTSSQWAGLQTPEGTQVRISPGSGAPLSVHPPAAQTTLSPPCGILSRRSNPHLVVRQPHRALRDWTALTYLLRGGLPHPRPATLPTWGLEGAWSTGVESHAALDPLPRQGHTGCVALCLLLLGPLTSWDTGRASPGHSSGGGCRPAGCGLMHSTASPARRARASRAQGGSWPGPMGPLPGTHWGNCASAPRGSAELEVPSPRVHRRGLCALSSYCLLVC